MSLVDADAQISLKDERKFQYALDAVRGPSPFVDSSVLEPAVKDALIWQSQKAAQQVIAEREAMVSSLEEADALMRKSGAAASWYDGYNSDIAQVCCVSVF